MEFFDEMPLMLKTFWFIAIPVSLIFLIQSIMTFVGGDAGDGIEADFDSNLEGGDTPFQLFSFRNLTNFLLGFSWTGISFYTTVTNQTVLIGIALIVGVLFVLAFFFIIRQVQKLAENNSFKITDTIGKSGEVYLTIPASKQGKGKVLVSVKGSLHELDALTDGEAIPSGSVVNIIAVENNKLLIVKPL
jgi:membrane protein implicated in regulation of membrane protease activity